MIKMGSGIDKYLANTQRCVLEAENNHRSGACSDTIALFLVGRNMRRRRGGARCRLFPRMCVTRKRRSCLPRITQRSGQSRIWL